MQTIWHILLTVCLGSNCIEQDVQWFDEESFRGDEIGSTDVVKTKPRSRCASDLDRKILINANDNFAPQEFALAA